MTAVSKNRADEGDKQNGVDAAVRHWAEATPDKVAVHFNGQPLSYSGLSALVQKMAGALAKRCAPGARIGYLGQNSDTLVVLILACVRSGLCAVPINWRLSRQEISYIVSDSSAEILFVEAPFAQQVGPTDRPSPDLRDVHILQHGLEGLEEWLDTCKSGTMPAYDHGRAFIQLYTSGTTGFPKGVVITNERYTRHIERLALDPTRRWIYTEHDDIVSISMPMFHVSGSGIALETLSAGATIALLPTFDAQAILVDIAKLRVTRIFLVPAALRTILELPEVGSADLSCLKILMYGGSPITPDLQALADQHLSSRFIHCYGMTEAGGNICVLDQQSTNDVGRLQASVGKPIPRTEIRIVDGSGNPLEPGQKGELQIRSDTTFASYWRNEEATSRAYTPEGWVRTGDIGYIDDEGFLFLLDRLGDMIISGGENIYPIEIERILANHPDIAEVAIVGIDDPKWGQVVTACVVSREGGAMSLAAIQIWLDGQLARYKYPRALHLLDALPRNAAGKVLRAALRDLARDPTA